MVCDPDEQKRLTVTAGTLSGRPARSEAIARVEADGPLDDTRPILQLDGHGWTAGVNGHFNVHNLQPGAYTISAWDSIRNVEYANPEWMRQYAEAPAAVTIEAGQDERIKLIRRAAPLE